MFKKLKSSLLALVVATVPVLSFAQTKIDLGTQTKGTISGLSGVNVATPTYAWDVREGQSFDFAYNFNGTSTYTSVVTEAKTSFGTPFNVMFDNTQQLYLGKTTTWKDITITFAANTTATNTLTAQYWNGTAWTALTITDGTSAFQNSGAITFTIPGSWAQTAVNGSTAYWVRLQFGSTPSTAPTVLSVRPGSNGTFSAFAAPSDTVPALAVSGGSKTTVNGVAVAPEVTYTVGLYNDRLGKNADFVCTGAKDQVCIQKAIAACAGSPCIIQLLSGTFNITGSIGPLFSKITFRGMGPGKTIIKSSNMTLPTFNDTTTGTTAVPLTDIAFQDMEIDRDADTHDGNISRKCIFVTHIRRFRVTNIYGHGSGATCIGTDFLDGAIITHNRITNSGSSGTATGNSGIGIGTGDYTSEPVIIANNIVEGSGLAGVLLETQATGAVLTSNNQIVANNVLTGASKYGVYSRGVSNVTIENNVITLNGVNGVLVADYSGGVAANVLVKGNLINNNSGPGVSVTAASNLIDVGDNLFNNNTGGSVSWSLPTVTACASPTITNTLGNRFSANVGTACTGVSTATFTLPFTPIGWMCSARNTTNGASSNPRQTGAFSTTSVTITNFNSTTGVAAAWTDADVIAVNCSSL